MTMHFDRVRRQTLATIGATLASAAPGMPSTSKIAATPGDMSALDAHLTGQGPHRVRVPSYAIAAAERQRGKIEGTVPLRASSTALLVIDMQNAFVGTESPIAVASAAAIVPNINELAGAMRRSGGMVVWVRMTRPKRIEEWSALYLAMPPAVRETVLEQLTPGSTGHQLYDRLQVHADDLVMDKTRFSALIPGSSTLDHTLRKRGIDSLVITGTLSNVCCESTLRDAMMLNYSVCFVSDGNAAPNDELHNAALVNVMSVFGEVIPTSALIKRMLPA